MRKFTVVVFVLSSAICRASNLTLHGQFTADDGVQLFSVSVAAPATVDIRSYGYAGGTTSAGTVVPRGGFDTILTLFSASGVFIDDNDDGAGVATDPNTGLTGDARLTETLTTPGFLARSKETVQRDISARSNSRSKSGDISAFLTFPFSNDPKFLCASLSHAG